MARFRIREDARTWFDVLRVKEKVLKTDFDCFYFCFMAGIASGQRKPGPLADTAELVDNFPESYGGRRGLLVSLLLLQELAAVGVLLEEKNDVRREIARLISTETPNWLSDDGVHLFNAYAYSGFDVLQEWFGDRPQSLATFLQIFKQKFDETIRATPDG